MLTLNDPKKEIHHNNIAIVFVDSPVTEDVLFENGKVGPVCHTNGKFIMTSSLIT